MSYTFEKGKAYFANPTIVGPKKVVVACVGRRGGTATFSRVNMLKRVDVRRIEERDTALIKADDGTDYFVSAAGEVDVDHAAEVMTAIG